MVTRAPSGSRPAPGRSTPWIGPSENLSAALDSKCLIMLSSCNLSGVYSNQEIDPLKNIWLGWQALKEHGYGCGRDGSTLLVRNREGRLLLVVSGWYSDLEQLCAREPVVQQLCTAPGVSLIPGGAAHCRRVHSTPLRTGHVSPRWSREPAASTT